MTHTEFLQEAELRGASVGEAYTVYRTGRGKYTITKFEYKGFILKMTFHRNKVTCMYTPIESMSMEASDLISLHHMIKSAYFLMQKVNGYE